jgi:hypothetical protein
LPDAERWIEGINRVYNGEAIPSFEGTWQNFCDCMPQLPPPPP